MLKKQSVYKPKYKKFLKLKENIQNKKINKFLRFKKQKWTLYNNKIVKQNHIIQKTQKTLDILPKLNYYSLYDNNKFLVQFYSGISKKKKSLIFLKKNRLFKSYFENIRYNSKSNISLISIEHRLDLILYRSKFAISIRNAQRLIKQNHIFVNNKIINKSSYSCNYGDRITVKKNSKPLIIKNIINSQVWPTPLSYLTINYKTLEIYVNTFNIVSYPIYIYIPFWFNSKLLVKKIL